MPYRKFYRRRRRPMRRRFKRRGFWKKKSRSMIRFGRMLSKFAEHKSVITAASDTSVDVNGVIFRLSDVAQGSTRFTRVGDKLTLTSLEIRADMYPAAPVTSINGAVPCFIRVIVFQWLNENATDPIVTDILDVVDNVSMYEQDPAFKIRYRILKDKHFVMNPSVSFVSTTTGTTTAADTQYRGLQFHWKFTKFPRKTISYSTGDNNQGTNFLYMLVLPTIDELVTFSSYSKLAWIDP